jgi:hypothetical protein
VLIGVQLISFAILARRYAALAGILPPTRGYFGVFEALSLERVLQAALAILLCGVVGFGWAFWYWASHGFGPIVYHGIIRVLIPSLMAIAVAVQLAATAFLTSVLSLRRMPEE